MLYLVDNCLLHHDHLYAIDELEKEYAKCFPKKKNEDFDISELNNPELKVLIQTVNRTEFYAAMMQLKDYRYKNYIVRDETCRSFSYYYVGEWGKIPVVIIQTDMGDHGVHGAWYETKKALCFMPQLEYIFSVGVCGGVAGKVELGDVVISKAIYGYSDVKRTPTGWIDRNLHFLCKETDAYRCFTHAGNLAHTDARVKPGIVLSGPWLIADAKAQEDLLEMSKEAIAFDMEGANIVQACSRGEAQCMIVKGVSDLADKEKSDDHQAIAATNAAEYLCYAMNQAHHLFSVSHCVHVCICVYA